MLKDKVVVMVQVYPGQVRGEGFDQLHGFDKSGLQALASIPSRDELLSKLLYVMKAPVTGMAVCLGALAQQREEVAA